MKLIYGVNDKPKFGQVIVFAFQQLLAILAATIAVPAIIGNGMAQSAALFGAGAGTLIYLLFTKFRSPVFLGSSFAFIGSMFAAFAGGVSTALGFSGLIMGAAFAGLVYVIIALVVKFAGVNWINKLMPPVVIGPTVAIIGLSLSGNAVGDVLKFATYDVANSVYAMNGAGWAGFVCALVTIFVVILCSVYGKKGVRLIPFIIGILGGYATAAVFTLIGHFANVEALKVLNFEPFLALFADGVTFSSFISVPEFTFISAIKGFGEITPAYVGTIAVAYIPVAFVVFAEHIADHKNLSTIIDQELLEDPGLHRTLLGDGIGSIAGALFGGCPNTTYGESVGCVAITKNASIITILTTAILAVVASFVAPFVTFLSTIPACVMGGVCITLYGFIAVSGLKMLQGINLSENKNLFVVSVILITGVGGMALQIGAIKITTIACALILGIIVNLVVSKAKETE
ncbi:MAG: uracil-xanthine permease [Ruminococcaceae bacterium]|nr:uracil-xanthine permease [Oscillospiraceae bacterium]